MATSRPIALVTGASGGIGLDIATLLAARGHDLVLVARRESAMADLAARLKASHGATSHVIAADLAQPGAADRLVDEVAKRGLTVDVLVNNAGYGLYGPITETDPMDEMNMLQLNVVALYRLTKLLVPGMVARKQGRVMNVASTAAFFSGPLMAVYYASKAFVLSFSEALDEELAGTGVNVTCLCPGPTRTEFRARAGTGDSKLADRPQEPSLPVAEAGVEGLFRSDRVVIPGMKNRLETSMPRFLPRKMVTGIVRGVMGKGGTT
ncbi:MAG: SDR family oxidoreductase [Gemmatimonadetes bacterium]|nr:SDR family oxidoreductase [Gemmatimonadota bacterium]